MVSHLCDKCYTRYVSIDLAERCEKQGIPEPKIPIGTWVKYEEDMTRYYGLVTAHKLYTQPLTEGNVLKEVNPHKLACKTDPNLTEVEHSGTQSSSYWYREGDNGQTLEESCVILSPEEREILKSLVGRIGFMRGVTLSSFDFLRKQKDWRNYLK